MRYLEKTFTIYPTHHPKPYAFLKAGKVKVIDPKHEYSEIGGMCRHCSLDRIGHRNKYEK